MKNNSFWRQWLFAHMCWGMLIGFLVDIAVITVSERFAAQAMWFHYFLCKYREPVILESHSLAYKFSDGFLCLVGIIFIFPIIFELILNSSIITGGLLELIYGFTTGIIVIKKARKVT